MMLKSSAFMCTCNPQLPLILTLQESSTQQTLDVYKRQGLGRQPLKTVWEYIINDFITATNNLPESYNSEPQRATVGAVSYTHLLVFQ